ncbi:MAG TPA: hypothetical protein VGD40_20840 [Chryseosolibacter sp.]
MDRYNFDEEEVMDNELKSVAYTIASFVGIIVCVTSWILFA